MTFNFLVVILVVFIEIETIQKITNKQKSLALIDLNTGKFGGWEFVIIWGAILVVK